MWQFYETVGWKYRFPSKTLHMFLYKFQHMYNSSQCAFQDNQVFWLKYFWRVNFSRRTMHSKSPAVNLAEGHETLLANKWLAVCSIHLLIIHCFISLQYSVNINDCIIFRHFFSVGTENCYGYVIILIILYRVRNWYNQHFYGVKCSL